MKSFKYMGKYVNEESLPAREHPEGYVPFKEPKNMDKLAVTVNIISLIITLPLLVLFFFVAEANGAESGIDIGTSFIIGAAIMIALTIPHEFLHGIAMNGEVQMYQNLKQGLLFVISTDDMSKGQFVLMSMLPNVVFGFIPFVLFLIFPHLTILGSLGAFAIGAGAGDYLNVFNTLTQVPNGAAVYMSGVHSYWYKKSGE